MSTYLLDVAAVIFAFVCLRSWLACRKQRAASFPLPPGPKGLPIIGNMLDMSGGSEWEAARQWGEKYGDLVHVKVLGTHYLFLNSYDAAIELFVRRGSSYSDRYQTAMLELEGWSNWFTSVMAYGSRLRKSRQHINDFFQKSVTKDYYQVQTQSTQKLLAKLLRDPGAYSQHIKHWAAESIIKITYGFDIVENDPNVELIDKGLRVGAEAVLFHVVNVLPALRHLPTWFPGTDFHKVIQEGRSLSLAMRNEPYQEAKRKMADGKATQSMLSKLLEPNADSERSDDDKELIKSTVAMVYGAGGDTTAATLTTFVLAMVLYPETMRKGQGELDEVVGKGNLPTFEDRSKLPYIRAICSECVRWHTVGPLGIPHLAGKDDVYDGYFIPAGTVVIGNSWAMLRDPKMYPEPDKFIPERWLPEPGKEPPLDVDKVAFGFGRRICPGRFFAENSLFIGVASILAVFDIEKAMDGRGVPITPKVDFDSSIVRHPKPFKCKITPRFEEADSLVHQAASPSCAS